MGLIPRVKCSRCDRSYSGMKNKCPYCGARRNKGGKRAVNQSAPMAQIIIKGLILLALLISVITMVTMSLNSNNSSNTNVSDTETPAAETDTVSEEDDLTTPTPTPSPTPTPVAVTKVDIEWLFYSGVNEVTISVGDELEIWCNIYPTDAEEEPTWSSEDSGVVAVTADTGDSANATIKAVGRGKTTITATAGGVAGELIVYVN